MLTHMHLHNFAIVPSLSLDFFQGFSVLTGETGAGKSIWIGAMGLVLGERADPSLVGPNAEFCDISLSFDLSQLPKAYAWLLENDFASEQECLIRRMISRKGTSKNTINGIPCSVLQLKKLGDFLIQIHSQHQHQTLLKKDMQRQTLDHFADNENLLSDIQTLYQQWQSLQRTLDDLQQKSEHRERELDFLRYQLEEFSSLNLQPNEWQTLSKKHAQLHQAQHLMAQLNTAISLTIEQDRYNASELAQQALAELQTIKFIDAPLQEAIDLINTAMIHLQEAGSSLNDYRNHLDLNPDNLTQLEARLSQVHDLARKHHVNPEALFEVEKSLQQKIAELETLDEKCALIAQEQTVLFKHYQTLALTLTEKRQIASEKLAVFISKQIQRLGIVGGEFQIEFTPKAIGIHAFGQEEIQFLVKTNPQHGLQPMQKIVSGGELSRISLALQVAIAEKNNTPTLIFDEVDVGISGSTATIVGELLLQLGKTTQTLCITHLAQVAALGEHHYQIDKTVDEKSSVTQITLLTQTERTNELARLLGGKKITAQTLAHAAEMLGLS